jgi:putative SOS response-associated peptidase YedK
MCSVYEIGKLKGNVPLKLDANDPAIKEALRNIRLIRRTDSAPVCVAGEGMVPMRWGYERPGLGVVNNARSENLGSAMWRESYAERRCLIPMAAFYEWSGPKGEKRTHRFTSPGGGLLWAAGIWEESAQLGCCYSMLTTSPNAVMEPIHNRMPALLGEQELEPYLEGALEKFTPAPELLCVHDAPNPLRKKRASDGQGELNFE